MKSYKSTKWLMVFFLAFFYIFTNSCEDNPARSISDETHPTTIGFTLEIDDLELVRYYRRVYTLDPGNVFAEYVQDDTLLVFHHGNIDSESMMSEEITIRWLGNEEEKFSIPEWSDPDGEFFLGFDIFEPGSRTNILLEGERPFEVIYDKDQSSWKFQLLIMQSGAADLRLRLVHGDHNDMVPIPLPVLVVLE